MIQFFTLCSNSKHVCFSLKIKRNGHFSLLYRNFILVVHMDYISRPFLFHLIPKIDLMRYCNILAFLAIELGLDLICKVNHLKNLKLILTGPCPPCKYFLPNLLTHFEIYRVEHKTIHCIIIVHITLF